MQPEPRRKGAVRRADIPPEILLALNEGREETVTLVEYLAIDMSVLLRSILPSVGLWRRSRRPWAPPPMAWRTAG